MRSHMVFGHLVLSATHAEAAHFTHALTHQHTRSLTCSNWRTFRLVGGWHSEAIVSSPPPLLTLSPALLLSPAAVTIETPLPISTKKSCFIFSFIMLNLSFGGVRGPWLAARTCHAAAAPICHISPPPGRTLHFTASAVQQSTFIVVTDDQQWIIIVVLHIVNIDY